MELFHSDQLPITISGRNCDAVDRGSLFIGGCRCTGGEGDNTGHRCNCKQQESEPFHKVPPFGMADESRRGEHPEGIPMSRKSGETWGTAYLLAPLTFWGMP